MVFLGKDLWRTKALGPGWASPSFDRYVTSEEAHHPCSFSMGNAKDVASHQILMALCPSLCLLPTSLSDLSFKGLTPLFLISPNSFAPEHSPPSPERPLGES